MESSIQEYGEGRGEGGTATAWEMYFVCFNWFRKMHSSVQPRYDIINSPFYICCIWFFTVFVLFILAYYCNLVQRKTARWSDNCFVVFDEVHHCHKDHPYRKLIQLSGHLTLDEVRRPKLLGLSASPASRVTAAATVSTLRELLSNIGAQTIIAVQENKEELAEYQSNAELVIREVKYLPEEKELRVELVRYLRTCCERLRLVSNMASVSELEMFTSPEAFDDAKLDSDAVGVLIDGVNSLQPISRNDKVALLVLCAHVDKIGQAMIALESTGRECAFHELQVLLDSSFFGSFEKACEAGLPCDRLRQMTESYLSNCQSSEAAFSNDTGEKSDKVITEDAPIFRHLTDELITWWDNVRGGDSRMALVLVKQRTTAVALKSLLGECIELKNRGVRATHVVGHGRGAASDGMPVARQARVIAEISRRGFDVIVATSVAEEGVDLPVCDLVIQLDAPDCVRALVQVRGRARKFGSRFVAFCRDAQQRTTLDELLKNERRMVEAVNQIINAC